jgi:hypothetical protein
MTAGVPEANDGPIELEVPTAMDTSPSVVAPNDTEDPITTAQPLESPIIMEDIADVEARDDGLASLAPSMPAPDASVANGE